MPIFIRHHHLLYNLLNVLIGAFHCTIHLRSIRRKIVVLDLELRAEFHDYSVVEISTIIYDSSLGDAIMADKAMLNEPGNNILSIRGE